jgi:CRISPR-associated protein Cmr4
MKTCILGLLAETSIHPGGSEAAGVVDLPVAREAATDYPVIPGSSLKGALLGLAREQVNGADRLPESERNRIFGQQDHAGALLVSDARLLLLPVRSLQSAYKWVTCPHLLERFQRDRARAGQVTNPITSPKVQAGKFLGADPGPLFLEERQFERQGELPTNMVAELGPLIRHSATATRLANQLVIIADDDFAWFARHGLPVQARNVLDPEKKTSQNLWYEETIPSDALFYALLAERQPNAIEPVTKLFDGHPYLQVGGNETVGMGWFTVKILDQEGAAA